MKYTCNNNNNNNNNNNVISSLVYLQNASLKCSLYERIIQYNYIDYNII